MTAKAEEIQGLRLRYCIQNIVRTEMKLKIFSNEDFILVCLRRSKICKISSILQIKWSVILEGYFNTHFLGFFRMGSSKLECYLLRRDCSNLGSFSWQVVKVSNWAQFLYWWNQASFWMVVCTIEPGYKVWLEYSLVLGKLSVWMEVGHIWKTGHISWHRAQNVSFAHFKTKIGGKYTNQNRSIKYIMTLTSSWMDV